MKHSIFSLLLILFGATATRAQITNPAPYCVSEYSTNYNIVKFLTVKGYSHSVGPAGSWGNTTTYKYFNNVTFPNLVKGDTASVKIDFWAAQDVEPMYFALWIDFNHDNAFDTSEITVQNAGTINAGIPYNTPASISKVVTIPATAITGTTRMRLIRGQAPGNSFTYSNTVRLEPCVSMSTVPGGYGCVYDYNVNIVAASAPVAAFSASPLSGIANSTNFAFTNASTNGPTTSTWTFTPANVAYQNGTSATSASPVVRFTAAGTYTVKLKVSNAAGSDSLTKTSYITVTNAAGIGTVPSTSETAFYPNPAAGYVRMSPRFEGAEVTVCDLSGKLLHHRVRQEGIIDLRSLPPGVYFATAVLGKERITTKIVLENR